MNLIKAVLEMKGHLVTDVYPEGVIVYIGDDLTEAKPRIATVLPLKVIVYIVSESHTVIVPKTADKVVVLRSPVTAEELLNLLNQV